MRGKTGSSLQGRVLHVATKKQTCQTCGIVFLSKGRPNGGYYNTCPHCYALKRHYNSYLMQKQLKNQRSTK